MWLVQSQPDHHLALCEDTGELYEMPVRFVVEASRALPAQ